MKITVINNQKPIEREGERGGKAREGGRGEGKGRRREGGNRYRRRTTLQTCPLETGLKVIGCYCGHN